ncbi:microtubule-associated protein tau isoform X2 [Cephus cinctus]|uniref:Microtubule-associated protein n=1 Tax=Cephus cinctus TaxID=211228 RepID=A0AAJ7BPW3_CEPCN|nr:microtubule-associated protein tau isoform X2 [Cephus cinctus]
MDPQQTPRAMADPVAVKGDAMVKQSPSLPPAFQARPQGPASPRYPPNNGPTGGPRPLAGQPPPLRRLDSRSSIGSVGPQQFQTRPNFGPPRPPSPGNFAPRPTQQFAPGPRFPQNPTGAIRPGSQSQQHPRPPFGPAGTSLQRPQRISSLESQPLQNPSEFSQPLQNPNFSSSFEGIASPRPGAESRNAPNLNDDRRNISELYAPNDRKFIGSSPVLGKMTDLSQKIGQQEIKAEREADDDIIKRKPVKIRGKDQDNEDDDDDVVFDSDKNQSKEWIVKKSQDEIVRPGTTVIQDLKDSSETNGKPQTPRPPEVIHREVERPAATEVQNDNLTKETVELDKSKSPSQNSLDKQETPRAESRLSTADDINVSLNSFSQKTTPSSTSPAKSEKMPAEDKTVTGGAGDEKSPEKSETPVSEEKNRSNASTPAPEVNQSKSPTPASPKSPGMISSRAEESVKPPNSPNLTSSVTNESPKLPKPVVAASNPPAELPSSRKSRMPSFDSTPEPPKSATSNFPSQRPPSGKSGTSPSSPGTRTPSTPEHRESLSVPGSASPSRSSQGSIKGFDNGQRKSLSPNATPPSSPLSPPKSPKTPKSPGGARLSEGEKKRATFSEESITRKEKQEKTPTSGSVTPDESSRGKSPTTPTGIVRRPQTPLRVDKEKSPEKKTTSARAKKPEPEHHSRAEENTARTNGTSTNGIAGSPTKKSPSKSKDTGKRSTAASPTKSPSKSAKSLPKTPDTAASAVPTEKKIPMNKVQVGAAPSPNLKTVRSKIGSLENASYKPGGGKVKIENRKLDFSKAQPKIAAKNEKYTPSGGDKKITQVKLQWNAKPKVGSLDNATYKPGGGDKKIETVKLDFKDKAKPKVGSKDNAKHVPGGGSVKSTTTPPKTPQDINEDIETQKIDIKAESKVGSLDNVKHKPGGGDKKIFNDKDYLRQTGSNVDSLSSSGSQVENSISAATGKDNRTGPVKEAKKNFHPEPHPPPPTRSPSPTSTPRPQKSNLAKTPESSTPKKVTIAKEEDVVEEAKKTKSRNVLEKRSPRSPTSPRPPNSLPIKSSEKTSTDNTKKSSSPRDFRLPKLAASLLPESNIQDPVIPVPGPESKIALPKLVETPPPPTRTGGLAQ